MVRAVTCMVEMRNACRICQKKPEETRLCCCLGIVRPKFCLRSGLDLYGPAVTS
jgi:hypothetical protein